MKYLRILIFLLVLVACKQKAIDNNKTATNNNEARKSKTIANTTSENNFVEINFDKPILKEILDKKLIGLSIKDSTQVTTYERYWLDFYTTCMMSAISIFIDTKNKKIHFIEYSEIPSFVVEKEKIVTSFDILKVGTTSSDANFTVARSQKKYGMSFLKLNEDGLYEIKMDSELLNSDIGRYKFYINQSKASKFSKEECGGFDG